MSATMPKGGRGLGWLLLANILLVLALGLHLAMQAQPSTEAVRLRNALVLEPTPATDFNWTPVRVPANFRVETQAPDPRFVAVVRAIGADRGDDLSRMLALAAHLTENAKDGGGILADNWYTYQQIREGKGYCADFTQTFLALAHAAGLWAREWGFSFDGFGGQGHAVVEAYDRQRGKWVFLDVFNNFHVLDRATGEPLDVAAWRKVLLEGREKSVKVVLNGPGRFGWPQYPEAMWKYYRNGVHGWYLWLGNDVETYDGNPLVGVAGKISRSLEQMVAILLGVHPHILVLGTDRNGAEFAHMRELRQHLLIELPALALGGLTLPFLGVAWWRRRLPGSGDQGGATRVMLVGPLPPPSGGMANQCQQLADLLVADGVKITLVQTNKPYWPAWMGRVRGLRAACRLLPYLWRLWTALPRNDVVHVFANSGWAWHLFALPALVMARLRRIPAIVNYHGGEADRFFGTAPAWVRRTLGLADVLVVPSGYLQTVFRRLGYHALVVPNVVDLARFRPRSRKRRVATPHVIVTRNLEPVYDIPTAIRAFGLICEKFPSAWMTVAGSGPELDRLKALVEELGLDDRVAFTGRIDNRDIHALYGAADLVINPSTADNMPISLLEAFASGVPVVSTNVGGIPYLVRNGENALLVPPGNHQAMADAALAVLDDPQFAARLAEGGLSTVSAFAWPQVRRLWLETYAHLMPGNKGVSHA